MHTLHHAQVLTAPDDSAPAIIFVATDAPTQVITRHDFRGAVRRYAHGFVQMGVHPRDLVIIAQPQNLEGIYAFWGALLIGAIPSMFPTLTEKLDPQIYMNSMAELVRLSDVKAILTTDDFAPQLAEHVNCPVYGTSQFLADESAQGEMNYSPNPTEIAFLQHSSGSTGLQKGVALSHEALLAQVRHYSDAIALTSDDVIVSWLPLYHDMGLIAGFLMPLLQGVPLVLISPFDWVAHPAMLFRAIHDHRGTLCWLPNFAYNHCARRIRVRDTEGLDLRSMRLFINCSEPVRHESHTLFLERFAPHGVTEAMLTVSYAMAENTFAVTQTPIGQIPRLDKIDKAEFEGNHRAVVSDDASALVMVSCGKPIMGTTIRVVDGDKNPLPERYVGEIAIKSDYMLTEYYRRPDLQPFTLDGWFLTGDMGYVADGEVYIAGRYKDLIINAGKNVYPQDIEAVVSGVEGIRAGRVVCFGVPDEREGTELIAVVAEAMNDDPLTHKSLVSAIKLTVAQSTTVTVTYVKLVNAGWLIKTSSGKIARSANRDKWMREQK
ncbi:MAG: AMP-binding protein [bacterium]|nr:AMP-binding protein [bacterium]